MVYWTRDQLIDLTRGRNAGVHFDRGRSIKSVVCARKLKRTPKVHASSKPFGAAATKFAGTVNKHERGRPSKFLAAALFMAARTWTAQIIILIILDNSLISPNHQHY